MKFLSALRQKKIQPVWEFKTRGLLWRILFSGNGRIVGEDRDQATKSVSFFCLDEATGKVLWSGLEFNEKWWIGIEAIEGGTVFFHEYVKPDFPQHFKIIAVDVETGRLRWRNDVLRPLFIMEGKVYAAKDLFERSIYYRLNAATGEVEKEFSDQEENLSSIRRDQESANRDVVFPETLSEVMEDYAMLIDLIRAYCDLKRVEGNVEFVRHGDLLIFNYHQRVLSKSSDEKLLENCLKVIGVGRRRLIYSELLTQNAHAPTPDSFFLKSGQLFFIKERNKLVAVRLDALQQAL